MAKAHSLAQRIALLVLVAVLSYAIVYPVTWVVLTSLRKFGASLPTEKISLLDALFPKPDSLPSSIEETTYYMLLFKTKFPLFMWNSVYVSTLTMLLAVLVGTMSGYAFSRYNFPGKRKLLWTLLVLNSIPGLVTFIPLYRLLVFYDQTFRAIGLPKGTFLGPGGLILVYLAGAIPYSSWFLKSFFDTIPRELDEQALVDGATPFQIFWKITLPLALPGIATIAILVFLGAWNEFMLATLLLSNENYYTLPVFITQLRNQQYASTYGGIPAFAAASFMASIPVVILFVVSQKYLKSGLTMGAVKG
ncbi:sugar ABC transporter permease [Thermofilum pendens]|uniref:Binding-protein-dependent transport systems inner membrane component n=1 Tax=Thermofilum pendens (strain DSM 2475 / Hrk 5) TaxID=368408 RepID=A1RZ27_THEPD|nr:ABC transporter permease subunit [Thermofilum pendens]ABL78457.1 binding-protein-dependent transport systems inner membrane component [Thermofilum pendens Hrk 5]